MAGRFSCEFVNPRELRGSVARHLLDRVYTELYCPNFPEGSEREDRASWERAALERKDGQPVRHVLVAKEGPRKRADGTLCGFVVVELYSASGCGLVSYLAVAPAHRERGLARKLVARGVAALRQEARGASSLRAVFGEIHDPDQSGTQDTIDPRARLRAMARLGARRVPVTYVQPALAPGGDRARHLLLVTLSTGTRRLRAETVRLFLRELYVALGVSAPEADPDYERMRRELPASGDVELVPFADVVDRESPLLHFREYAIAFHLVVSSKRRAADPRASVEFESFERDMLSYSFRERRPFASRVVPVAGAVQAVEVEFPTLVEYESEGRRFALRCCEADPDGTRRRSVALRTSRTDFATGISVLHLVLVCAGSDGDLNEYDLIKLAKLWEGGERFDAEEILFRWGAKSRPVEELARAVFAIDDDGDPKLRGGTVQLVVEKKLDRPLWRALRAWGGGVRHRRSAGVLARALPALRMSKAAVDGRVMAIGGIVQGLLDFRRIDAAELADVFEGLECTNDGVRGIHKGTLLSLTAGDRAYAAARPSIGMSPYLLVSHAVLLHNEMQLERAARAADQAPERARITMATKRLKRAVAEMHEALDRDTVPNVFHYSDEKAFYTRGEVSRGLPVRDADLRNRLTELHATWEAATTRRRQIADDLRNSLVFALGGTGIGAALKLSPHDLLVFVIPIFSGIALIYFLTRVLADVGVEDIMPAVRQNLRLREKR